MAGGFQGFTRMEGGRAWAGDTQGSTGTRGQVWAGGAWWPVWPDGLPGMETRLLLLGGVRGLGEPPCLRCWGINPPDYMGAFGMVPQLHALASGLWKVVFVVF